MSTSSTALPSGVSPPLTTDNADNHTGLIVVITAFCLVLIVASLAARVFSSYQRHILQQDDYFFGALVIVSSAQAAVVLSQVHYGWGAREGSGNATGDRMLKAGYAADILSMIVLGCSKITTCLFYEGLFSNRQSRAIRIILAGTIIWTVLSVLLVAIRCSSDPWSDISAAQCSTLLPRWQAITAIDIVTEVMLFVYSGLAVYRVRISTKEKIMVFLALESRVLLIPLAAIRFYYTSVQLDSTHPTLLGAFATVTTEIYLALSVVCLVTAFVKSFIAAYEDRDGISYTEGASGSGSRSLKQDIGSAISSKIRSPASTSTSEGQLRGWECEEDPIMEHDPETIGQGLHVLKTVHFSMRDESIELADQRTAHS
ncbi:hypothetical protein N7532_008239 [Penicillium argentinense]|uniref:Rhodopsin domain-containing protein n=1 Tax=Penicillium argentinense TaxID=1131581 RepID=A0A9W9EXC5_9EURO|nr:uncharacterized protein N7532_008239 [Penicillium argentinense]KAJ5089555.1 hypothetical protein N7532_008239 [Penicillium argentinense]